MENFLLIMITTFALIYIYKSTFKNNACNCKNANCLSKKSKNNEL